MFIFELNLAQYSFFAFRFTLSLCTVFKIFIDRMDSLTNCFKTTSDLEKTKRTALRIRESKFDELRFVKLRIWNFLFI